jgi:hypothetical protein
MRVLKQVDHWFTHTIPRHWLTRIMLWSGVYLLLSGNYLFHAYEGYLVSARSQLPAIFLSPPQIAQLLFTFHP